MPNLARREHRLLWHVRQFFQNVARFSENLAGFTHSSSGCPSSLCASPWGTPSVELADRFDALASQTQTLADAADKKDEQAIEEARIAPSVTLEGLKPLISNFKGRCFAPDPVPVSAARIVSGRLPPEVIQKNVRTLRDRFGQCFGAGVLRNPELKGVVAPRFVIVQDGTVPWAVLEGATLPDKEVVDCIVLEFTNLVFPPPIGGLATVINPIMLSTDPEKK